MHASFSEAKSKPARLSGTFTVTRARFNHVVVCVDETHLSRKAISHGAAIAIALNTELTLMRALDTGHDRHIPPDPVGWELRRRHARAYMESLAQEWAGNVSRIRTDLMEGDALDRICTWMVDHRDDLTVLCTHRDEDVSLSGPGSTAHRLIDCMLGSVLLVPSWVADTHIARYRRVIVPLDGSSRAESALPVALRICKAQKSELLLLHVVPETELTETGPLEPEGIELRQRLSGRNERVGRAYLDRIRARIAGDSILARTQLLRDGDTRHLISRTIVDEAADLAVISSHGRSGRPASATGGVAGYLIARSPVPLMVVRDRSTVHRAYRADAACFAHSPVRAIA